MDYFIQVDPKGTYRASWEAGSGQAVKLGVADPWSNPTNHAQATTGESEVDALKRVFPQLLGPGGTDRLIKLKLAANEYHPRMARPLCEKLPSLGITPEGREDHAAYIATWLNPSYVRIGEGAGLPPPQSIMPTR